LYAGGQAFRSPGAGISRSEGYFKPGLQREREGGGGLWGLWEGEGGDGGAASRGEFAVLTPLPYIQTLKSHGIPTIRLLLTKHERKASARLAKATPFMLLYEHHAKPPHTGELTLTH